VALPAHEEQAAHGREVDDVAGVAQVVKEHVRRGQRGVAAQVNSNFGGKPAEVEAVSVAHEKGRFGQVVLGGNLLHQPVVGPTFQGAHGRGIAAEGPTRKSVYLVNGYFHKGLILFGLVVRGRRLDRFAAD
jgi:hypothetical protein